MITIVKPIPYLHTTAKNETAYTRVTLISTINKRRQKGKKAYRVLPTSCLASFWRTSISIMAASRYLCTERTIFTATISFFSLSKHSKTCPKVPAIILPPKEYEGNIFELAPKQRGQWIPSSKCLEDFKT